MKYPNSEPKPVETPVRCPACGARELNTTSKVIDRNTYWRCLACGEVWNLIRRETGGRFGYRR
jgi:uncharacterized Zn finger protein